MPSGVQPGDILLGKYQVERVLGQGGMGVVVAVRHVQLGELFAIKMLLPSVRKNTDATERFLREARASARLKGEHVARVHDVGSLEDGAPYMVMEYLTGDDLKQILKRQGPFPIEELALFVHQACEAVAEAHALGIVHRDLKPANLFLTRRPNGMPCVKVLDFGISKELEPSDGVMTDLTKTGTFMGSPPYMSPEQMADIKATDRRSDIWSLGIILYELSTGQLPFRASVATELVAKVLTTVPPAPSELCPDVSPQFDAVVARCLEKRPENRYQTPQELAADLVPLITGPLAGLVLGVGNRGSLSDITGPGIADPPSASTSSGRAAIAVVPPPASEAPTITDPNANAPLKATTVDSVQESTPNAMQSGHTDGAWGNTNMGRAQKDKKVLLLVAALLAGGILAAVLYLVVKPLDAPAENTVEILPTTFSNSKPLAASPPSETVESPPPPVVTPSSPIVQAMPSATASIQAPAPVTKSSNKPTNPTKPAGTSTSSVAGFND